ncbi:Sec-independent protein translocase protein TatB [Aquisediminimonas sediminicola]|uniref:Sec-independent protein translocase protein TatB n=1 Tax=Alteraquisediminimonas sediminicola TaxID=2676787 RepID=UPI001C8D89F1|nr:Sec-independent protein translocase protein TatB [Aquisediminimonas sediminicola]
MFDVASSELLMVAVVALVVIGPKDLPRVMRVVGHWLGKARGVARHFRAGMDEMIRQSEMDDLNRKWAEQNERIMREHPMTDAERDALADADPVMTPRPDLIAPPPVVAPVADDADVADVAPVTPADPSARQEG